MLLGVNEGGLTCMHRVLSNTLSVGNQCNQSNDYIQLYCTRRLLKILKTSHCATFFQISVNE